MSSKNNNQLNIPQRLCGQVLFSDSSCMIKRKVFAGCYAGSFNYCDLIYTGSQTLFDQRNIILHTFREHTFLQPQAS